MSIQGLPRTSPGLRVTGWARRGQTLLIDQSSAVLVAIAVAIIVGLPLMAMFAPLPHDPLRPDTDAIAIAPNGTHWFGTDGNGMDIFSRTIEAAKLDLPVALAATALSLVVGVPLGLFATSGRLGDVIMRIIDAFAALPIIVIAVVAIKLMGGGAADVVLAIAIVAAPRFVRLSRASAMALRSARYVEAAAAIGCSPIRIAFNHIFRNAYGVVLVQATLTAANALGTIAALNFLGVGVKPPTPTWGAMINDGVSMLIRGEWWAAAFPTLAMLLAIGSLNVIAGAIETKIERVERAR